MQLLEGHSILQPHPQPCHHPSHKCPPLEAPYPEVHGGVPEDEAHHPRFVDEVVAAWTTDTTAVPGYEETESGGRYTRPSAHPLHERLGQRKKE